MTLKTHSPHLSYFLERIFTCIPTYLEESFSFALARGGNLELDYQRPEGQSFNPRPARIALIGIKDADIKDLESVQILILSSLFERSPNHEPVTIGEINRVFPYVDQSRIRSLADLCELNKLTLESLSNSELGIYLCSYIDRMRHAHLSGSGVIEGILDKLDPALLEHYPQYSNLKSIIENWNIKMRRQFPKEQI